MILTERQEALLEFVKKLHGSQVRKYTGEPYWTHPYEVARLVSKYEPRAIEIALCHDLFEDTDCPPEFLERYLVHNDYSKAEALEIVSGVSDLTDEYTPEKYPDINRSGRKLLEAARLQNIPYLSQCVKLADLMHNSSSIFEHDKQFAKVYLREKIDILDKMRNGHIMLLIECCAILRLALSETEI